MKTRSYTKTGPGRIPFGRTPKASRLKAQMVKKNQALEAWAAVGKFLGLDNLNLG